ncbi:MAG: TonB-dependent receptor domain-containing protein [Candidatus Acidiferrales bacterium]
MTNAGRRFEKTAVGLTAVLALTLCLFCASAANAQVTGATLSGTITDPSGSVIAGAEVTIKNLGTGIVRTVTTDSAGLYLAPNLIPGNYEAAVTARGFSKSVQSNLTLSVGQQQSLNIALKVGESSQTVTVEESAPTVELTSATLSAQVNSNTVRELPLNGRDWTQLATLQPGVNTVRTQASTSSPTTNRANRGFGNQLTDSGHSPYENSYRVNGININDYTNGSPGSVIGANLGTDAIQEFSVLTTDYTAEYGRTSGAVINSITKSGTNEFHGTAFGFLRNASLDAKNYFDPKNKPIPPFERYQYGGAIGGPIIKDKTFFFGAYDGVEQHRSNTTTITVPSAASRAAASSFVQPYLNFWPVAPAGTPTSPDGSTQSFATTGLLNLKENYATARVDHHFSDKDTLSGSWLFDRGPYTQPDPLLNVVSSLFSFRQMYEIEETHIFSPTLVNTARFGYSRSHGINGGIVGAINPIAADATLGVRAGIPSPIIAFGSGGVTPTASVGSASQNLLVSNSFQFYDDAFWVKGTHTIKFGIAVERIQFNVATRQRPNGQFTFSNLQAFLNDIPSKVQELQPGNAYEVGSRNTAFGFYVQDDWKAKSNLSINIGLRYEPVTLPSEASNRFAVLTSLSPSNISTELPTPVDHLWSRNPTLKNFEPRIGFSWDPFKDGKTAVRGGFGMFDILPIPWTYTQTLPSQYPFTAQVTASGLSGPSATCPNGDFPVVCSKTFNASSLNVVYVPQNPGQAYAMNWNLNVQRQVTPSLTVTLGYVGSRSIHLPDLPDNINYQLPSLTSAGYLFPATSVGKLDTAVGSMRARLWDNDGWYNGLQLGVTKQLSHGLQLQGSYSWSQCLDTGSNMAFNDPFQNSIPDYFYFDHRLTKGLCDYNISQNGVVSFIYSIPTIGSKSGFEARILGGWQVGTILTAQSGSPFTPVIGSDPYNRSQGDTNQGYVDIVSGCNPINANWKSAGSNGLQYLNLNCFAPPSAPASFASQCTPNSYSAAPAGPTYCANLIGNLGRNQITGPGLFDMDFSVFKNIRITERVSTQFRVEMFNVLNHPSFLPPLNNEAIFNLNGSVATNAAVVDTTSDDPRQIQFGMKVIF